MRERLHGIERQRVKVIERLHGIEGRELSEREITWD